MAHRLPRETLRTQAFISINFIYIYFNRTKYLHDKGETICLPELNLAQTCKCRLQECCNGEPCGVKSNVVHTEQVYSYRIM